MWSSRLLFSFHRCLLNGWTPDSNQHFFCISFCSILFCSTVHYQMRKIIQKSFRWGKMFCISASHQKRCYEPISLWRFLINVGLRITVVPKYISGTFQTTNNTFVSSASALNTVTGVFRWMDGCCGGRLMTHRGPPSHKQHHAGVFTE